MKVRSISQVRFGAVLSYILIVLNAAYALIITPYIIRSIGQDEYGVYKIVASLSSALTILDFGLGGTVQRYVANYRARNQEKDIPNFVGISLVIGLAFNFVIILVSIFVYLSISPVYSSSLSATQLLLAHKLFVILVITLLFTVIENVFNGVITGYNNFIFGNGVKIFSLLIRIILVWISLKIYRSALSIVCISLGLSILMLFTQVIFIRCRMRIKIRITKWDKGLIIEAGKYTSLMFLTSIATQIFSNVDNIVIGALCSPSLVTIYSIGLQFFSMFQNLSTGMSGVMLPTITNAVIQDEKNNDNSNVVNLVIKAGRIQFCILGGALVGFICIGKDFVQQWIGSGYDDVYIITLILLIPAMFELCINVCLSILRAKNKLGFRTIMVFSSAILNAILTFFLVRRYSYIGAAVATAMCYIAVSLIAMNVYYCKVLKLPMKFIYKGIFKRIWLCLFGSGCVLYCLSKVINGSWISIFINIFVFCAIYMLSLILFAIDIEQRSRIPIIKKFL